MIRPRRLTYRGALQHVTMRCNNKEFLFEEQSQAFYLDLLREFCGKYGIRLYNYCLMTNHVHLLFRVKADGELSAFMQRLAGDFARRFNAMRRRKGHLWEGRFLSAIIEPSTYFLRCMAFIDLNPVRARMVQEPADYQWSGHHCIAAEDESLIQLHAIYRALGGDKRTRYRKYLRVIQEEAAREPYSLAHALFVGSSEFAQRMRRRFRIVSKQRPRLRTVDLGGGACAVELRRGGRIRQ